MMLENVIIDKFDNLDDIINYSLCSSYIPYVCGNKFYMEYKNQCFVDGHIFRNKEVLSKTCHFSLDKKSWGRKFCRTDGFYLNYDVSKELFENGWKDTMNFLKI